jgi:hypothetical protein
MNALKALKPYNLRRWKVGIPPRHFFTCARPGRTGNPASKSAPVSDNPVHRWVVGLPGPKTAIVSLLGRKPDGTSEFSFYSFHGGFDCQTDHHGSLSFQEWLRHENQSIVLREHPTEDFRPIPTDVLDAVASDIAKLLSEGRTVVVIDSGGQTRTKIICNHMHAIEDSSLS